MVWCGVVYLASRSLLEKCSAVRVASVYECTPMTYSASDNVSTLAHSCQRWPSLNEAHGHFQKLGLSRWETGLVSTPNGTPEGILYFVFNGANHNHSLALRTKLATHKGAFCAPLQGSMGDVWLGYKCV